MKHIKKTVTTLNLVMLMTLCLYFASAQNKSSAANKNEPVLPDIDKSGQTVREIPKPADASESRNEQPRARTDADFKLFNTKEYDLQPIPATIGATTEEKKDINRNITLTITTG